MSNKTNEHIMLEDFINSLPYPAIIINKKGIITTYNKLWKTNVLQDNIYISELGSRVNYFTEILPAFGLKEDQVNKAFREIKKIISGRKELYRGSFCCFSPQKEEHFAIKAKSFKDGALIIHEEMSDLSSSTQEKSKNDSTNCNKNKVLQEENLEFEPLRYDQEGNPSEYYIKGISVKINGKVKEIFGVFDNITEIKRQQEKLEAIFKASKNVAFVMAELKEDSFNIKEFSPGAENIFGYNKQEILEKPISTLHPQTNEQKIANIRKKIKNGESWQGRIKLKRKNGKIFAAMLNVYPFEPSQEKNSKALGVAVDINELEKTRAKLEYLSYHDELTGLYNRKFMEENMERLDTQRQLPISLIMLDVNGLKIINDTFGHKMGDRLLIKTSEILESCVRQEDIVARWAGDEFVILLPKTDKADARKISARIRKKCQKTYQKNCEKKLEELPPVSLGMGIAVKNRPNQNIEAVLNSADKRMYQDKRKNGLTAKREMINCLLHRLYARTFETETHTLRITRLAMKMGEELNLHKDELEDLARLSGLHDIGKLAIEKRIIKNNSPLTQKDCEKIKNHPEKGARLVNAVDELAHISELIKTHHENWNGTGYPQGLLQRNIPLLSRIFSIIDAYDVMITGRPYQPSVSKKKALKEIRRCGGSQFDPSLSKKFVEMIKQGGI